MYFCPGSQTKASTWCWWSIALNASEGQSKQAPKNENVILARWMSQVSLIKAVLVKGGKTENNYLVHTNLKECISGIPGL